jgi:hypothetical protein
MKSGPGLGTPLTEKVADWFAAYHRSSATASGLLAD